MCLDRLFRLGEETNNSSDIPNVTFGQYYNNGTWYFPPAHSYEIWYASLRNPCTSSSSRPCATTRQWEDPIANIVEDSGTPVSPSAARDVAYSGIRHLLDLRGGGGDATTGSPQEPRSTGSQSADDNGRSGGSDTGAGVWRWLMDEQATRRDERPSAVASANVETPTLEANVDSIGELQCTVCQAGLRGEDWGWCLCRTPQCGVCIGAPLPYLSRRAPQRS